MNSTVFQYRCSCGATDFFQLNTTNASCNHCYITHTLSPDNIILFDDKKTEQNAVFDRLYGAGKTHIKDDFSNTHEELFANSTELTQTFLQLAGMDEKILEDMTILDVACGSGWVTAGLLKNEKLRNCKLHAFDISTAGTQMLARFAKQLKTTNRYEISVQNAEAMNFADKSFDMIIGNSILHHFNDYEEFLTQCARILKPGGIAIFGEPFALGYGLAATALLIAQRQLNTHHEQIELFYNDLMFRNKSSRPLLKDLVDKHLFIKSKFLSLTEKIGFSSANLTRPNPHNYYRENLIDELLFERGIEDKQFAGQANAIWNLMFNLFDTDDFIEYTTPFMNIVLTKAQ